MNAAWFSAACTNGCLPFSSLQYADPAFFNVFAATCAPRQQHFNGRLVKNQLPICLFTSRLFDPALAAQSQNS